MDLLYEDNNSLITLKSLTPLTSLTDSFDNAAKFIYENKGIGPENLKNKAPRELLNEINKTLTNAVTDGLTSDGIKYQVPATVTNALRENVWRFSGMKTYHQLKEASQLLVGENGEVKSFSQFKQDIQKINSAYNERHLEVEYNYAVHSAQIAAKWNDFEQDGDEYNLQFRTAGDDKVRTEHAALNDITLPPSDPFWNDYIPPLDWGCRCTVVQVRKNKYPQSNSPEARELGKEATTRIGKDGSNRLAMFRGNPGKDLKIFPDKHPYFPRGCADCPVNIQLVHIPKNELCQVCKIVKEMHEHSASKSLYKELIGNTIKTETSAHNSTGVIRLNSYGLRNFLDKTHSATQESKQVLSEILNGNSTLGKPKFEPLNMNRPNIQKKINRGWQGVNVYSVSAFGKEWNMKTAIIHNKYEVPYSIKKMYR